MQVPPSSTNASWILLLQAVVVVTGFLQMIFGQDIDSTENKKEASALTSATSRDTHIMCYTCHFHVQKGHSQGMENCRDPFLKSGIPEVPCQGPCGKIYRRLSVEKEKEDEYMVIRNCVPNCKDLRDDKGFTTCCSSRLCNSGNDLVNGSCCWTVLITAVIITLLTLER